MAIKSKAKTRSTSKGKTTVKAKSIHKAKGMVKAKSMHSAKVKEKALVKKAKAAKAKTQAKPVAQKTAAKLKVKPVEVTRSITPVIVKRTVNPLAERRRPVHSEGIRTTSQYTFMKPPGPEHAFEVGDNVEVFCDHEKGRERVRGWIKGIVVQVDNKMVAVQFRSNVFLTDGWMVPDRILWYPLTSEHIRPVMSKKSAVKKDVIPDY
ncbi:hypothetical protein FBQ99_09045 [Chloroflexi bacterium CFX2]|nr:hypothetical protein [Chloroflexi bacterium CFX2]